MIDYYFNLKKKRLLKVWDRRKMNGDRGGPLRWSITASKDFSLSLSLSLFLSDIRFLWWLFFFVMNSQRKKTKKKGDRPIDGVGANRSAAVAFQNSISVPSISDRPPLSKGKKKKYKCIKKDHPFFIAGSPVGTGFHRVFTRFYAVFKSFTRFDWVWLGLTGFDWVWLGLTGFDLVWLGYNVIFSVFCGFHSVEMVFTEFYLVLLSLTGFYLVWLGFTGFYWVITLFLVFFVVITRL